LLRTTRENCGGFGDGGGSYGRQWAKFRVLILEDLKFEKLSLIVDGILRVVTLILGVTVRFLEAGQRFIEGSSTLEERERTISTYLKSIICLSS